MHRHLKGLQAVLLGMGVACATQAADTTIPLPVLGGYARISTAPGPLVSLNAVTASNLRVDATLGRFGADGGMALYFSPGDRPLPGLVVEAGTVSGDPAATVCTNTCLYVP